ncbi:MAG: hypothetical protein E7399_01580 [Ruminococcaceae bacterium]|nr:hypothetical protein [Oscillospiraceae bacterium]
MNCITVNPQKELGKIKPMNAVNNGPVHKETGGQHRSNLQDYANLHIPYARNHDASFCPHYGGEHTVDVHAIFPDFSKDPYDPASYDFVCTDHYLKTIEKAGTKVFYRLGSKIEHGVKKYGTLVPPDFQKWAVICEHIIRHYTEGWADGFHMDIEYWEIWAEPNIDLDDAEDKRCWGGTAEEFFQFYTIASKHLKGCFPHLKIGGPSSVNARYEEWNNLFLERMQKENAPLDFFSWHRYCKDPRDVEDCVHLIRNTLDKYGFYNTESNLDEWNYVRNFTDEFCYTLEQIIGMKGAAFASAVMSLCQDAPLDMLMYYDVSPGAFNGLFDYYTFRRLKTYYAFHMFSHLYLAGTQIAVEGEIDQICTVAAKGEKGVYTMLTYFSEDDDNKEQKEFEVQLPEGSQELFLLDEEHDAERVMKFTGSAVTLSMKPNSVILIHSN